MIDVAEAKRRTDSRLERVLGDRDSGDVPLSEWRFMAVGTDVPSRALVELLLADLTSIRKTMEERPDEVANVISGLLLRYFWFGYEFGEEADG